jgi:hypothetical protein
MIFIPASIGELIDKITILKIKTLEINDKSKLKNVQKEYDVLTSLPEYIHYYSQILNHYQDLLKVNYVLWHLEEDIRRYEKELNFKESFIETARKIYKTNDERSRIKKEINILCNSELVEEKSHEE